MKRAEISTEGEVLKWLPEICKVEGVGGWVGGVSEILAVFKAPGYRIPIPELPVRQLHNGLRGWQHGWLHEWTELHEFLGSVLVSFLRLPHEHGLAFCRFVVTLQKTRKLLVLISIFLRLFLH